MFGITIRASRQGATIKLNGLLRGPSTHALAELWRRISAVHLHEIQLDLSTLDSIDPEGEMLLRTMRRDGATFLSGTARAG